MGEFTFLISYTHTYKLYVIRDLMDRVRVNITIIIFNNKK